MFERHDVETLVALLHEDATMTMPPFAWWLRGRADIATALSSGTAVARPRAWCRRGRTAGRRSASAG
ncbi:hypothetical protein [Saccharothrix deserti]|uniref:hypothetical protein n=1 Tax=Saccharothrix deserti TaxID=2593674 RepID=UPI001EE45DA8|nr:hypothetical protein [Saccharothrix deserti]